MMSSSVLERCAVVAAFRFQEVVKAMAALKVASATIDGEAVWAVADGHFGLREGAQPDPR
jgi:hypothetical protein